MFKDGLKNMAWGLSQQWIGGSQVMWLQEHVVLHHMHTGDVHMDPDAQMAPAMRGTIPASPFTPSTRLVSRNDGRGWSLFRVWGRSDRVPRP